MTRAWSKRPARPAQTHAVRSRAEWRELARLARQCCADAGAEAAGADAELRLMTLSRRCVGASTALLEREGGATVADTAKGFLRFAGAFARATTPAGTRRVLAPVVEAAAVSMDDQLHALNTDEFKRAHAGRPEVWR